MSTIQTNAIVDASGGNTTTVNGITPLANTARFNRNLIINGDFQINQRGNGSGVGNAGYIGVDRWHGYISTSSTIYFTQTAFAAGQSDVDKNLRHYLRFDWLGTGAATTKILNQRIEGAEKGNGQNVTLSFWGRTEQADDCTLKLIQNFGSGGSSQTETSSGTIDLTTSWQYFTHTFALPSTSGKTVGTNHFLELQFIFGPATLNSYFDITGVQLEYGDTATDFEHRSYGEELALCQRYFQVSPRTGGSLRWTLTYYNTKAYAIHQVLPMRALPTVTDVSTGTSTAASFNLYAIDGDNMNSSSTSGNAPTLSAQGLPEAPHIIAVWDGISKPTGISNCPGSASYNGSQPGIHISAEL